MTMNNARLILIMMPFSLPTLRAHDDVTASRTGRRPLAAGSLDRDSGLVAALRRHEPRAADALVDTYGGRAELPRPQYEKHGETAGPRRTSNKQ